MSPVISMAKSTKMAADILEPPGFERLSLQPSEAVVVSTLARIERKVSGEWLRSDSRKAPASVNQLEFCLERDLQCLR